MCASRRLSLPCALAVAVVLAASVGRAQAAAPAATLPAAAAPRAPADDDDGVHAILCFSGGGTRAAAFAHGAALGLAATDAGGVTLLDRIDRVVGVSGGSLTAAQVAIDRRPEALARFEREVLREDLERVMLRAAASSPYALLATDLTRGDVAVGCFDERLLGTSFAALPARPELWIQTTDMVSRRPLVLSRAGLPGLGLDPATFQVARAVAASTAFPGIFPPLRVDAVAPVASTLYLGDGGIVDNLGLEPALDAPPPSGTRAVVVVVVNARCGLEVDDATLRSSVRAGAHTIALQQRRLDELVLARARDRLRLLELEARLEGRSLSTHLVVVDFAGSARREKLDAIGTRFALDPDEVTLLVEEGREVARRRVAPLAMGWPGRP